MLAFCLLAVVTCAKLPKRPKKDPYADFADDKDLEVPEDDDDKVSSWLRIYESVEVLNNNKHL